MHTAQGEFRGARAMSTYYQTLQPDGAARALVIVAHGAAEHSGRYEGLAQFLTARGFAVAALDHAGHGRSDGTPGFVESFDDFVETLEPMLPSLSRAVAHCFTGEHESLREYLAMGLWIGITGWICDERRGAHLHDIVSVIPDDRLLIETDAPYLLPRTIKPRPKSRRNEPSYLPEVLRVVAEARGQTEEHVATERRLIDKASVAPEVTTISSGFTRV